MRVPGAVEMLDLWERGGSRTPIERSLELLNLCAIAEDPGVLSIGRRDASLFRLREKFFGRRLSNIADCPSCGERVEWGGDVRDFLEIDQGHEGMNTDGFMLDAAPYSLRFRLPNSYDLLNVSAYRDNPEKLLKDCILEVHEEGEPFDPGCLPEKVLGLLEQRMAEEDPQADISMLLNCPKCSHAWEMSFDICSYLWMEIDHWARRVLREVAMLAAAFGWSELDILRMSSRRRQLYLEMIRQ
jgi:hypothetical protein